MRRVWNEATADEKRTSNFGDGGLKVGDYGQDGRVYRNYTERPGHSSHNSYRKNFCLYISVVVVSAVCLYWVENSLYFIQGCLNEAAVAATTLSEPIHVKGNDNKLVFLSIAYPPKVDGPAPKDPLFGIEMPVDAAVGKRKTEYCQWKELKPKKKGRQAGEERDPCVKKSECKECQGVSCQGKAPECSSTCCRIKKGRFTYRKDWRAHLIPSAAFPTAYYNPQRDPAPSHTFFAGGNGLNLAMDARTKQSVGNALYVSARNFQTGLQPFEQFFIAEPTVSSVSQAALAAGFGEADHQYFYSLVQKDGRENPMVSKGFDTKSVLASVGMDWIMKEKCQAGDIRVSFLMRKIPNSVSVLGLQKGNQIVPYTYSNGRTMIFLKPASMDLQGLIASTISNERLHTNIFRVFTLLVWLFVGGLRPGRPGWLKIFVGQLILFSSMFVFFWLYLYGIKGAIIPMVVLALLRIFSWMDDEKGCKVKEE